MEMDKTISSAIEQVTGNLGDLAKQKNVQVAAIGAAIGYMINKEDKNQGALIGGIIGYLAGTYLKSQEDKKAETEA